MIRMPTSGALGVRPYEDVGKLNGGADVPGSVHALLDILGHAHCAFTPLEPRLAAHHRLGVNRGGCASPWLPRGSLLSLQVTRTRSQATSSNLGCNW